MENWHEEPKMPLTLEDTFVTKLSQFLIAHDFDLPESRFQKKSVSKKNVFTRILWLTKWQSEVL